MYSYHHCKEYASIDKYIYIYIKVDHFVDKFEYNTPHLAGRMPIPSDAPFLALWYVKVLVLLAFTAYAVISFIGIYRLTYGQPLSDLAPDGSYLQKYDALNQVRGRVGPPESFYLSCMDVLAVLV